MAQDHYHIDPKDPLIIRLAYGVDYLNKIASVPHSTDKEVRTETINNLRNVFDNLLERFKFLNEIEQRSIKESEELRALAKEISRCSLYIKELQDGKRELWADYENATRYIGMKLLAGDMIEDIMTALNQGENRLTTAEDYIGAVNGQRFAHIWGHGLMGSILEKLPGEFATPTAAQPYTGPMSFILYFTRLAIELRLLWTTRTTAEGKFQTQWPQRKFLILNDLIWGFANLAGYVCQTILKLKNLGAIGNTDFFFNTLTVGLLIMDLMLLMVRFHEEQTKHNAEIQKLDSEIQGLLEESPEHNDKVKIRSQLVANWKLEQFKFLNQGIHALALIVGFTIMTCLSGGMIPLVGAAVCFFFSTALAVIDGMIDIEKLKASRQDINTQYVTLFNGFNNEGNPEQKKLLYLDLKKLVATSDHQEQLISFQQKKLISNIFLKAVVPALVFGTFMFLSLGIGLAAVAASFAIALAVHVILKKNEPKADLLPAFNEEEYGNFVDGSRNKTAEELMSQLKAPSVKRLTFFSEGKDPEPRISDEILQPQRPNS
jgi:hypothetical protein